MEDIGLDRARSHVPSGSCLQAGQKQFGELSHGKVGRHGRKNIGAPNNVKHDNNSGVTHVEALVRPILLFQVQEVHPSAVGQVDGGVVADEERGREGADEGDPLRVGVGLGPLGVDLGDLGTDSIEKI